MLTRKASFLGSISLFLAGFALGGEAIPNWPAPATWSPARVRGGLSAMDVTNPLPFIGLAPCRIADTRLAPGPYGGPSLVGGVPRNFTLTGQCGIPANAAAVSLNVTVTNTQGAGFIEIFPAGGGPPGVSTVNYVANQTIANAAVVPLGGGAITVIAGVSGTDLILDTNGYYGSSPATTTDPFVVNNSAGSGSAAIIGENSSAAGGANGVLGVITSASPGSSSAGVRGINNGTGGLGIGVKGTHAGSGWGVLGQGLGAAGSDQKGVLGEAFSTSDGAVGVEGEEIASTGVVYGVRGFSNSASLNAAGVFGVDRSGGVIANTLSAGVRGESASNYGVFGASQLYGVSGWYVDSAGNLIAAGYLGANALTAADATGPPWGVFATGNLGVSGAKHFVEPHPSDPTKVILYSSLEGREVGTYFRGTARTVSRRAVIEVPEDFRIVTDEEGLTVQLTPVGPLTTMSVEREDLNRIVVRSSQDVTFHYLVQGVRRAFKDFEPVANRMEFAPRSADERMPLYLTEEAKRRLIANGTYNPDGTVNMDTAERAGWTKIWVDRQAAAEEAARAAQQKARLARQQQQ